MWFAALVGGVALAIVVITPGGPRRLWESLQSAWMAIAGVGLQLVLAFVDVPDERIDDVGFALLMASYALILAFCFVNLRWRTMWIVALGIALNTIVVGLNEGMPTAPSERTVAGRTVEIPVERTVKQRPESDDDLLGFLGAVIELPGPGDVRMSVGDLLIAAGVIAAAFELTRRRGEAMAEREAVVANGEAEPDFAAFWGLDPTKDDMPVPLAGRDEDDDEVFSSPELAGRRHEPISAVLEHEADSEGDETPVVNGIVDDEPPEPPRTLTWDDDELERKLAAGESRALVSEPERVVVSEPKWPRRVEDHAPTPPPAPPASPEPARAAAPEPAAPAPVEDPTPTPPPISWTPEPEPESEAATRPPVPQPAVPDPAAEEAAPDEAIVPEPPPPPSTPLYDQALDQSLDRAPDQAPARSSDQGTDDPLALELDKLFARLSRGPDADR